MAPVGVPPGPRRSRRAIPYAVAVAALVVAAVVVVLVHRSKVTSGRPEPRPTCGGQTVLTIAGVRRVCTFDDEFAGTALDTTKWTAWNDENHFAEPTVCYYDDPQHVAVRAGVLDLSVTRLPPSAVCRTTLRGTTRPTYGAGVVHTKGKFSQTGGVFAARIKFAGGRGIHDDFWLYPTNRSYPGQAEIDVAEPFGSLPNMMNAATHMTGPDGKDDGAVHGCPIPNWAGGFHTYAVVWTPTAITFSYDGQHCFTYRNWTPLRGYAAPAPFDRNFFMILQVLADSGQFSPAPDASTLFPVTMQVDWVRAWK